MITSRCTECSATTLDGVLTHTDKCSANNFLPKVSTDYLRPPAIELRFDSKEEQDNFFKNLSGTSGGSQHILQRGQEKS